MSDLVYVFNKFIIFNVGYGTNHSGFGVPYRVKTKIPRTVKIIPDQKFADIGAKNKRKKSHYWLGRPPSQ